MKTIKVCAALNIIAERRVEALSIIAEATKTIAEQERRVADLDALIAALNEPAVPSAPRAARGSIEKAILEKLPAGMARTAEALRTATGQNPASLRKALARMVAAGAVTLDADDHYRLPAVAEAAQ